MNVLDTNNWDKITIVPPKSDEFLVQQNEVTYYQLHLASTPTPCPTSTQILVGTPLSPANGAAFSFSSPDGKANTSSAASDGGVPQDASTAGHISTEEKKVDDKSEKPTGAGSPSNTSSSLITRDPRNGAFTFSVNSEYDLLLHIQRSLDQSYRTSGAASLSDVDSAKVIMNSIDDYCLRKQWMYHVGNEKREVISKFLDRGIDAFVQRNKDIRGGGRNQKKFVCVELGTYCGYSALVLASTIRQAVLRHGENALDFHVYTTEISSKFINVAMSILRLSKMDKYVTIILIEEGDSLSATLKKHLPDDCNGIDFLLIDHAKNIYVRDLLDLESARLLRRHSYVCADNVIFNRLDEYRNHMKHWSKEGVVESSLEEMNLEYSNNLKDGMEMTIYLKDLPDGEEKGWWKNVWGNHGQSNEKAGVSGKSDQSNTNKSKTESKASFKDLPGARELAWWKRVFRRNFEQNKNSDSNGAAGSEAAVALRGMQNKGWWRQVLLVHLEKNANTHTKITVDAESGANAAGVEKKGWWGRVWRR